MKYLKTYEDLEYLEDYSKLQLTQTEYRRLEGKFIIFKYTHKEGEYKGESFLFIAHVIRVVFHELRFSFEIYEFNEDLNGYETLRYDYDYNNMMDIEIVNSFDTFSEALKEFKIIKKAEKYNI